MIDAGEKFRAFAADRLGPFPDDAQFIAQVATDGATRSVIVFHDWRRGDATVSLAGGHFAPEFIRCAFRAAFGFWKLNRVTAHVCPSRERLLRMYQAIGFQVEGYIRAGDDGNDLIALGLLPEDFRYEPKPKGPRSRAAAGD